MIHQELNLMPHLTVAQNIFIGREPRPGGFVLDDKALNASAAGSCSTDCSLEARPAGARSAT